MRIETFCDLYATWQACTRLGKIFYFWLMVVGFIALAISSIFINGVLEVGRRIGFIVFDE